MDTKTLQPTCPCPCCITQAHPVRSTRVNRFATLGALIVAIYGSRS